MAEAPWLMDDGTFRCFYCDVGRTPSGKQRDPDGSDKNLRDAHALLWSRPLPNGKAWALMPRSGWYLSNVAAPANWPLAWCVGSDNFATTHTNALTDFATSIPGYENGHLHDFCSIGGYLVFPNARDHKRPVGQPVRQWTINQAKGCDRRVFDRIDLTVEAIRLYFNGVTSRDTNPLGDVLDAYGWFFDSFGVGSEGFRAYIDYFFLTPLVSNGEVLPLYGDELRFENSSPSGSMADYLNYIEAQRAVVKERNQLINNWWVQREQ